MVEIANAAAGTYRVVVTGTRVSEGPQKAVVITSANASATPACSDIQEPNNELGTAYGNLTGGALIAGAICTAGDVDYFKFTPTQTGPVSVTITAGDTPLRVTLSAGGGLSISKQQDVAAGSTVTITSDASLVPSTFTLKVEATGALGANPSYTFTPNFSVASGKRRRSTQH
jgi:hypothetical protein